MATTSISPKELVEEVVKNVIQIDQFDVIKCTATDRDVFLESVDKAKMVVLKARTKVPVPGVKGTFGLGNLGVLSKICHDREFSLKESTLQPQYQTRGGEDFLTEFYYTNRSSTFISYRLTNGVAIPDQPPYKEPSWDIQFKPTQDTISQFNLLHNTLSSYEKYFYPKTKDGNLVWFIGEDGSANQRGGVVFARDVQGEFDTNFKWGLETVKPVLALTSKTDCKISLSSKGAIQIELDSGNVVYKYIFPGKVK
jgi:hypothetical protein